MTSLSLSLSGDVALSFPRRAMADVDGCLDGLVRMCRNKDSDCYAIGMTILQTMAKEESLVRVRCVHGSESLWWMCDTSVAQEEWTIRCSTPVACILVSLLVACILVSLLVACILAPLLVACILVPLLVTCMLVPLLVACIPRVMWQLDGYTWCVQVERVEESLQKAALEIAEERQAAEDGVASIKLN